MRLAVVAGAPSTGKTSVVIQALAHLASLRTGVVKFDCLASDDVARYEAHSIPAVAGLAAGQCPDHYFASNIPQVFDWGEAHGFDLLIAESAGLCNRCAPYIEGVPAICVCDSLAGLNAPHKMGPLLKTADLVVVTKGDMVSQAEREVFAYRLEALAPRARVIAVNGLTGQGALQLAGFLRTAPAIDTLSERPLRFSTPSALCSYCLGERLLGEAHQMGNLRRMELA